jgi:hypothetical protein
MENQKKETAEKEKGNETRKEKRKLPSSGPRPS